MDHRLKGKILIDNVFTTGKSAFAYPVKMFYFFDSPEEVSFDYRCGVSVSKRNLKKAVDRNLIKRRMRESFRLAMTESGIAKSQANLNVMLVYVAKDTNSYKVIDNAIRRILSKAKLKDLKLN